MIESPPASRTWPDEADSRMSNRKQAVDEVSRLDVKAGDGDQSRVDHSTGVAPADLVNSELTNGPHDHTLKKQLVVSYLTINTITGIELEEELVNRLFTLMGHDKSSRVLAYISKHPVWLMATSGAP